MIQQLLEKLAPLDEWEDDSRPRARRATGTAQTDISSRSRFSQGPRVCCCCQVRRMLPRSCSSFFLPFEHQLSSAARGFRFSPFSAHARVGSFLAAASSRARARAGAFWFSSRLYLAGRVTEPKEEFVLRNWWLGFRVIGIEGSSYLPWFLVEIEAGNLYAMR